MTTEVTEGMPQKPGVLQGDDIADMWWQGQFGRYTYDNHVTDATFMTKLDATAEDTYFSYGKNRYKYRNKASSDPSKWPDSKIIYESVPKEQTGTVVSMRAPIPNAPGSITGPKSMMPRGITKEIKVWKLTVGTGDTIEAVNEMLADQEWTLFSAVPMEENNKTVMFVFIR